jgi:hypothetical protein
MTPCNGERNNTVTKGFPRRFRSFLIALMTTLPKSVVRISYEVPSHSCNGFPR